MIVKTAALREMRRLCDFLFYCFAMKPEGRCDHELATLSLLFFLYGYSSAEARQHVRYFL